MPKKSLYNLFALLDEQGCIYSFAVASDKGLQSAKLQRAPKKLLICSGDGDYIKRLANMADNKLAIGYWWFELLEHLPSPGLPIQGRLYSKLLKYNPDIAEQLNRRGTMYKDGVITYAPEKLLRFSSNPNPSPILGHRPHQNPRTTRRRGVAKYKLKNGSVRRMLARFIDPAEYCDQGELETSAS